MYVSCPFENLLFQAQQMAIDGDREGDGDRGSKLVL
jgi:hypothetical protein